MRSFKFFLSEGRGTIIGTGTESVRHFDKYIRPFLGSTEATHELASAHGDLPAGTKVRLNGTDRINGKLHVHAEVEGSDEHHEIPVTKLLKPGAEPENKGHKYEKDFVDRLKKHGIMPEHISGAGSTAGTDFVAENKKRKIFHAGTVTGHLLEGETKEGTTAAFGQLTIHHSKEKGWHIGDKARELRPQYAKEIEKSGILEHMNKVQPDPDTAEKTSSGRAKSVVVKHPSLDPAHAYLKDHHVKILQVGGGYGTYRIGDEDETGHGLPALSGKGRWTIRQKQLNQGKARTVMFQPDGKKGLDKSHVNLDDDEHIGKFKQTLGHE